MCLSLSSNAYVVQEGDTLANIVRKFYKVPPFGKDGGVAKLVELNKDVIKDPNNIPPGTELKLNQELLKDDAKDSVAQTAVPEATAAATDAAATPAEEPAAPATAPEAKASAKSSKKPQTEAERMSQEEEDAAEGLSPYIEVEKYDAAKPLKERFDDRFSVFAKFNTNNFDAEERTTLATTNFTTSSDLNLGFEYVKSLNDNLSILAMAMLSHYYSPENDLVTPNIDQKDKDQGAYTLGLRYLFTQDNYIDFLLNYHPHYYFLTNPDTGNMVLDHKPSPSASVAMKNFFYDTADASVGLDLGFELITNTEDPGRGSTSSFAYFAGLIYRQNFKTGDNISVEFNYKSESSDTVQYTLRNQGFGLSFTYMIPY